MVLKRCSSFLLEHKVLYLKKVIGPLTSNISEISEGNKADKSQQASYS